MKNYVNFEIEFLSWVKEIAIEFNYIGNCPLQGKFKLILLMTYIDIFSQVCKYSAITGLIT